MGRRGDSEEPCLRSPCTLSEARARRVPRSPHVLAAGREGGDPAAGPAGCASFALSPENTEGTSRPDVASKRGEMPHARAATLHRLPFLPAVNSGTFPQLTDTAEGEGVSPGSAWHLRVERPCGPSVPG